MTDRNNNNIEEVLLQASSKAKTSSLHDALEFLGTLEKKARNEGNGAALSIILPHWIHLCYEAGDFDALNLQIILICKKRGQLKQPITVMVQKAISYLDEMKKDEEKLRLIDTIRKVSEGKIYIENERAHVTTMLSKSLEMEGKIKEAADTLFELQVETYGSMKPSEKVNFFLSQMRLALLCQDYVRANLVSKKLNSKYFTDHPDAFAQKMHYHEMMIQLALHEQSYLECAKQYMQVYSTKEIAEDPTKSLESLKNASLFIILAPFDNEQNDLIMRIFNDLKLSTLPLYKNLLNCFITKELMRWPLIERIYSAELSQSVAFLGEIGVKAWHCLKDRIMEHNIRIIASYYSKMTMSRLIILLDSTEEATEEALLGLVTKKTIFAKVDRPAGIIHFIPRKDPRDILDDWASNVHHVLDLVVKVNHLIGKEEIIHKISTHKPSTYAS